MKYHVVDDFDVLLLWNNRFVVFRTILPAVFRQRSEHQVLPNSHESTHIVPVYAPYVLSIYEG